VHTGTGTDTNTGISYSFDSFIPDYAQSMIDNGIAFETVPEPSRMVLLVAGISSLLARRRRNR
jgi:hypothetical protein